MVILGDQDEFGEDLLAADRGVLLVFKRVHVWSEAASGVLFGVELLVKAGLATLTAGLDVEVAEAGVAPLTLLNQ